MKNPITEPEFERLTPEEKLLWLYEEGKRQQHSQESSVDIYDGAGEYSHSEARQEYVH